MTYLFLALVLWWIVKLVLVHLVFILAVWRLTNLVYAEAGPFDMFDHLRDILDKVPTLAKGRRCPLCVSIWSATLLSPFYVLYAGLTVALPVYILAWSGATCLIYIGLEIARENFKWNHNSFSGEEQNATAH